MINTFWMVYCLNKSAPTKQHATQADAEAEARRLAGQNIGQTFFVLEVMAAFRTAAPQVEQLSVARLPLEPPARPSPETIDDRF